MVKKEDWAIGRVRWVGSDLAIFKSLSNALLVYPLCQTDAATVGPLTEG